MGPTSDDQTEVQRQAPETRRIDVVPGVYSAERMASLSQRLWPLVTELVRGRSAVYVDEESQKVVVAGQFSPAARQRLLAEDDIGALRLEDREIVGTSEHASPATWPRRTKPAFATG